MTIIMTVAGVNCDAKVLDNEITCRIPKNMTIPSEGLPVKVSQAGSLDDDNWLIQHATRVTADHQPFFYIVSSSHDIE